MTAPAVIDRHRCLAGPACRTADKVDGHRIGARTMGPDTLCDPCIRHLQNCARQMPRDYAKLQEALGQRSSDTTEYVRSTPTPALPISVAADTLMSRIVDTADRAAAMIADQMHSDQPTGHRAILAEIDGKRIAPRQGTIASVAEQKKQPDAYARLVTWARYIEPNIEKLVKVETQDALVFVGPRRCEKHTQIITVGEALVDAGIPNARENLTAAYTSAGKCNTCCGWDTNGQAREVTQQSGLDIAQQISDNHRLVRAHLGHTRLRHHLDDPCPAVDKHGNYCGAYTVGRDNGTEWVNCTTCGAQWTEDEWDFLSNLIQTQEVDMLRYLLAEAYWRLDTLAAGADAIRDDPRLNDPGSGQFVLDGIDIVLGAGAGHQRPADRKTAA